MSPETPLAPAPGGQTWPMLRAMVGIGAVCALAIVSAYQWTKPIIEKNRAEALRKAIFEVLPGASASATFRLDDSGGFVPLTGKPAGERLVYAGYDGQGTLVGVAVEASGMGYQDTINLLYGYSPAREAIVGFQVLESRETPGLGDRINSDPEFLANFAALDVRLEADLSKLSHPIELVKKGEKSSPWQIDAITGATVSSRAVTDILRGSTEFWIPRLRAHVADLEKEPQR